MSDLTQVALEDSKKVYSFEILSKELINHNVVKILIRLPSSNHILGTKSGQHFFIQATINGEVIKRKYTPLGLEDQKGIVEFLVKIYRSNTHENYPDGGKLTQYLDSLQPGQFLDIMGPLGRCTYLHNGRFEYRHEKSSPLISKRVKHLGMVAGGSGIAAFLQISKTICSDPNDNTIIYLIFANHTEDDVIYREELDQFHANYPDKFKVWYTISKSIKPDWKYSIGYVNQEMFKNHLPPPGDETLIMVCGPKPMVWTTTIPTLENMGYTKDMIFKY